MHSFNVSALTIHDALIASRFYPRGRCRHTGNVSRLGHLRFWRAVLRTIARALSVAARNRSARNDRPITQAPETDKRTSDVTSRTCAVQIATPDHRLDDNRATIPEHRDGSAADWPPIALQGKASDKGVTSAGYGLGLLRPKYSAQNKTLAIHRR